ncbi:MAG: haloacid dehalogenase-like hydrolase [Spirochaetota bacterium]
MYISNHLRLEVKYGLLTGKFFGKNCYGPQKVKRIKEIYNLYDYQKIYAYGDSKGDKEMLAIADERIYRWAVITAKPETTPQ